MGKQRADISRAVLEVAVDRDDQHPDRMFEPRVDCRGLSVIAIKMKDAHPRIVRG